MCRVKLNDDPQAFGDLVARWQGPIRSLCTRMIGDPHRGEDLAQETFVRLYSRRKDYVPTGKFSTFLWKMAVNLCRDELRRSRRRRECAFDDPGVDFSLDGGSAEDEPAPDRTVLDSECAEAIRRALMTIDESHRTVVILRHYEGLKFKEIADVLGIPEGTVKSRMADALARLYRLLNPLFADSPRRTEPKSERIMT